MHKSIHTYQYGIFLAHLRAARREAGITQIELARLMDWVQADISKVENGIRRLDIVELRSWLTALDIDVRGFVNDLENILQASPPELLAKL